MELVLPNNYVALEEEEMMYLDGEIGIILEGILKDFPSVQRGYGLPCAKWGCYRLRVRLFGQTRPFF
ncbi:hypothetical protein [Streptococcus ruminantium]|uniref:hypothetical protein n=1 Tax=Streptococcus ruminantium TaxID=1917441 RepID=UPI001F357972|nr:hypothetical protein [Streptococcus ruminantium]BDD43403.1 hypothetical protein GUT189_17360 [Streptococcus ruminantium]